jgi:hypothetical protein
MWFKLVTKHKNKGLCCVCACACACVCVCVCDFNSYHEFQKNIMFFEAHSMIWRNPIYAKQISSFITATD